MSFPHHGDEAGLNRRFVEQHFGTAPPEYPLGKLNPDDGGSVVFRIAADKQQQKILVDFGKPVAWIGMNREQAEQLRDMLSEKILQLRGITV